MRRALPHLLALVLGIGAATLAACADGSEGGVPADAAADLKSELEDVRQRVDDARCRALVGQLRQVDTRVDRLPSSVDAQLRRRLSDGAENLAGVAERECDENRDAKEAETTTTETTTSPEPTESQPPTTTAEPPATATTPPPTMTTPPPAPAPQPAPAPAPNPGGGTPPQDAP